MLNLFFARILLLLICGMLFSVSLSASDNITDNTKSEMSDSTHSEGEQGNNLDHVDLQRNDGHRSMSDSNSYTAKVIESEDHSVLNEIITDTTSIIVTIITIVVALLTFLLTTAIPLLFKFYQRYTSHVTETEYQLNIIKHTNSILNWYDLVTDEPSHKNTLRIALEELTDTESNSYDQKNACASLVQLLSSNSQRWQGELRNLLCFMVFCRKISKEVKNDIGWQTLDKKLEEYGVTGKLPEFSAPQNFRKRVFAAQDLILFFVFFATLVGLLLVVIFKVS